MWAGGPQNPSRSRPPAAIETPLLVSSLDLLDWTERTTRVTSGGVPPLSPGAVALVPRSPGQAGSTRAGGGGQGGVREGREPCLSSAKRIKLEGFR